MARLLEKLRDRLASGSLNLFSAPYLPFGLILAALLLAFTDLAVLLLEQPAAYWLDAGRAESGLPFVQSILSNGLLPSTLAGLLYLALLWLLLTILTRSAALLLWLPVGFLHASHALGWAVGKIPGLGLPPLAVGMIATLLLGIFLVAILMRPNPAPLRRWLKWLWTALPVLWVITLVGLVAFRAILPKPGWQALKPEHTPGPRADTVIAYDPVRQRAVLFGGISRWLGSGYEYNNETWEWDGQDWTEIKPANRPALRAGHAMAYDEANGVMVMFGGEDKSSALMLNDTWLWDGNNWTQAFPQGSPSPRRGGQMFFDKAAGRIVLAGGFSRSYPDEKMENYADTWIWTGEDWQYHSSLDSGIFITNSANGYDPIRNQAVVFDFSGLLIWSNDTWTRMQPPIQPPFRWWPALAADPRTGKMFLFGGIENDVRQNDTWLLDGDTWTQLHPDLSPAPRDSHAVFFDPTRNSFIVYGGLNTKGYAMDDMWEFVLP
jgi:hypothetical protein